MYFSSFEKLGETALIHRRIGSFERAALLRSLVQTKTSLSVSQFSVNSVPKPYPFDHVSVFYRVLWAKSMRHATMMLKPHKGKLPDVSVDTLRPRSKSRAQRAHALCASMCRRRRTVKLNRTPGTEGTT